MNTGKDTIEVFYSNYNIDLLSLVMKSIQNITVSYYKSQLIQVVGYTKKHFIYRLSIMVLMVK